MRRRHFLETLAASSTAAALRAEALEAHEPARAKPMKIALLGTGTPSLDRQSSGYHEQAAQARAIRRGECRHDDPRDASVMKLAREPKGGPGTVGFEACQSRDKKTPSGVTCRSLLFRLRT